MLNKITITAFLFALILLILPSISSAQVIQGIDPTGLKKNVRVDASGNLTTAGGGGTALNVKLQDGTTATNVTTVAHPGADGLSTATMYNLETLSIGQCINTGSAVDRVRCGTSGGLKVEKSGTTTYNPTKTTTNSIAGSLVDVLASVSVIGYINFCVTLKNNDVANPLTDAAIFQSPDNSSWESLYWTACDTLVHGALCSYCISGNAYRYIKVQAKADVALTVSSIDAWLTANTN